ncbi:unnamed protein product [Schistosoma margrebowiei]|uniref:Uncharacterized protein n=1 Tax=Schistosoma margrebowiei TaxID=48269 RepID=A0A183M9A6_9TREM|nr:unnamed protein product [Schistosoma margrebowiei]
MNSRLWNNISQSICTIKSLPSFVCCIDEYCSSEIALNVIAHLSTPAGEYLDHAKSFTYLVIIIGEHGESNADVETRIGKTRAEYLQLKNVCNSQQLSTNTKVRIFNTNIKTVLVYGVETWRTIKAIIQKIEVFNNSCLHKRLQIRRPDTISNNLI